MIVGVGTGQLERLALAALTVDEGNRLVRYVLNGGVIIADNFSYPGGDYYVLSTPEEFLYVKRDDILIKSKNR